MKFIVTYAFDCPCYGQIEIEAETAEQAAEKARQWHRDDKLIGSWSAEPVVGCDNYRVVSITEETGEVVVDGFSLDLVPTSNVD